jgi:amidase
MAKSVADVAILLGVLEGAQPDPHDPATSKCTPEPGGDYTRYLRRDALKGARIGIPRAYFYDKLTAPGEKEPKGGLNAEQLAAMTEAIAVLTREGAVVIDPVELPSVVDADPASNFLRWSTCTGVGNAKGKDAECSTVLKYGMKRDFNLWLASLGAKAPVKTLSELRAFNAAHGSRQAIKYGQSLLDISDEMDLEADRPRYQADRAKDIELAGTRGIEAAMTANRLDALLFPASTGAAIAAKPGYPSIGVPFAMVPNAPTPPFPEGFDARPGPFGVTFTALSCAEPRLIELAYAFEQATRRRVPPSSTP